MNGNKSEHVLLLQVNQGCGILELDGDRRREESRKRNSPADILCDPPGCRELGSVVISVVIVQLRP